jgi:hypothetical protein
MDSHRPNHASGGGKQARKAAQKARKVEKYKRGRGGRRHQNKLPNYGRHPSPKHELMKGIEGMEIDEENSNNNNNNNNNNNKTGDDVGKSSEIKNERVNGKKNGNADRAPPKKQAISSGQRTLASLQRRHNYLVNYIKNTKASIALRQEEIKKDMARKEVAIKKEDEMDVDIDIS